LKYEPSGVTIRLPDRKALNQRCLAALDGDGEEMTPAEIFNSYTGIGGLHGLNYVDYSNYHDFSEAKKEIEQGQFFTPDALCAWVVDCIRPDERQKIADLTCGKGSFFNHLPDEEKIYGCEIEPDSYSVARHLFGKANLTLGDIRSYNPGLFFHIVIGNPPYNLHWIYNGKKMSSQTVYILKAAELLYPGGLLAVIVPSSLFGESTPKIETKRIYGQFSHVAQVALDPNAFSNLGVINFPTKLLILQRKANAIKAAPHDPKVVEEADSNLVYWHYVRPVIDAVRKRAPEIQLQINRESREKDETKRKEALLLCQIKSHPRTRFRYTECKELLHQYYTQKRPPKMSDKEWNAARLHYKPIMDKIRKILREQNVAETDKVELVKTGRFIHYKAN
jgi:predicted RNA methylase